MENSVLVLSYAGCSTCRKAQSWLKAQGIAFDTRPIVEEPPTEAELQRWIPASGLAIRRWLNTSGLSYRALGKVKIEQADDDTLRSWLTQDGKLVKRPVLVRGDTVLVGFSETTWEKALRR